MEIRDLDIAWQNALIRAWRGAGVPVGGQWRWGRHPGYATINVRCEACDYDREASAGTVEKMRSYFDRVLWDIEGLSGCQHLRPMRGALPPEVKELAELELLAG